MEVRRMKINYKDEELECITTLRVAMNIQKEFKKPYMAVLKNLEDLDLEEQIKILYIGIKLTNNELKFEDFKNYILDEVGLEQLGTYLEEFVNGLQYPGLTEEEIEKKLMTKAEKQKKMKEIGLID